MTTVFALSDPLRAAVKARRAPRDDTWALIAENSQTRDLIREKLSEAQHHVRVPVARDCKVLVWRESFINEEDPFDRENGFGSIAVDYVEEGSVEDLRRELLSDAEDYAASEDTGWFYAESEEDDIEDPDPGNPPA